MKMLIIGGTSAIGSSVTQYLIEWGYNIDVIAGHESEVSYKGYEELLLCDRSKNEAFKELIQGRRYDYIIDIDEEIKSDVMYFLNTASKDEVGKYMLCSTENIQNIIAGGL
ncbi:MAG: NAD-dependent epimerase/dehydratase family protein [Sarcina sp.]